MRSLLCDDFEKAACNREMVARKLNVEAYIKVENFLAGYSAGLPLPNWVPTGNLPRIRTYN